MYNLQCVFHSQEGERHDVKRGKVLKRMEILIQTNLTVVATEFSNNTARGDIPIKDLSITTARHQLCIIPNSLFMWNDESQIKHIS